MRWPSCGTEIWSSRQDIDVVARTVIRCFDHVVREYGESTHRSIWGEHAGLAGPLRLQGGDRPPGNERPRNPNPRDAAPRFCQGRRMDAAEDTPTSLVAALRSPLTSSRP